MSCKSVWKSCEHLIFTCVRQPCGYLKMKTGARPGGLSLACGHRLLGKKCWRSNDPPLAA
jgi:hypothetical protein